MSREIRFKFESATAKLLIEQEHRSAMLTQVFSIKRGQGHANGLMREIIQYADGHFLKLSLFPKRYHYSDNMSPDDEGLARFYEKFGFIAVDQFVMEREPTQKIHGS